MSFRDYKLREIRAEDVEKINYKYIEYAGRNYVYLVDRNSKICYKISIEEARKSKLKNDLKFMGII